MHIRTFRAASLQEALAEIRQEMGPEAAVLYTRQVSHGLRRFIQKSQVEVTAGLRDPVANDAIVTSQSGRESPSLAAAPSADAAKLLQTVEELSDTVKQLSRQAERQPQVHPVVRELERQGMSTESSEQILRSVNRMRQSDVPVELLIAWPEVQRVIATSLRIGSPIRAGRGRRRVVALAGPTGVGKTTTIAKLAAGFRLQTGFQVGLLTIDTFRMGAVQQLSSYAQIMDLPMKVVENSAGMRVALDELCDCDLVLIDSSGRSPRDHLQVKQLAEMLDHAAPDEIHLVVSAASSSLTAKKVIQAYSVLSPTGLILSKLDEVDSIAALLPVLCGGAPPLTYLTTGQSVPDDIERADANRFAELYFALPIEPSIAANG